MFCCAMWHLFVQGNRNRPNLFPCLSHQHMLFVLTLASCIQQSHHYDYGRSQSCQLLRCIHKNMLSTPTPPVFENQSRPFILSSFCYCFFHITTHWKSMQCFRSANSYVIQGRICSLQYSEHCGLLVRNCILEAIR